MAIRRPDFTRPFFAPDLDPSWNVNPGIVTGMDNFVPLRRDTYANWGCGSTQLFESGLTWTSASYGTPLAAYIFKGQLSGARFFVCSKTKIIELTAPSTITDRSKGGGSYSSSTVQWTMVSQGNVILAANLKDAMQVSTSGIFSDLGGGSPKAQCLATNLGFVMAGNYDDGVNAYGDGWWCSALGNYASWTASLATQAANGRLLDTPGPITCMKGLRDSIIAYKADSIYVGDYIGDTTNGVIWAWRPISDKVGCSSPHGVAVLNDRHFFLHRTGAYMFDGAQVTNIGAGINGWLCGFDTDLYAGSWMASVSGLATVQASVDEIENIIMWFADISGSTNIKTGPCYNAQTGRWGFIGQAHDNYLGAWQGAGTGGRVYAILRATASDLVAWDSTLDGSTLKTVIVGSSDTGTNIALRMGRYGFAPPGTADSAGVTLGTFAPADGLTMGTLNRIRLRLLIYDSPVVIPTLTTYMQRDEVGTTIDDPTVSPNLMGSKAGSWNSADSCFDIHVSGRNFVLTTMNFAAGMELCGLVADVNWSGME
jgi:hypothetical protein